WGVSWGVACLDGDVADGDGVTVHETFGVETVLPVLASFAGDVDRGAGRRGQFSGPGEVVGVDVGLGHRHDLHVVFAGQIEVDVDVSAGIDHDRFSFGLASDEVAGLGEIVVVEAFQQHVFSVGCRTARGPCVVVVFTHPSDTPGSIQWAECGPGHGRWGVT